jgi:hypothetical protein
MGLDIGDEVTIRRSLAVAGSCTPAVDLILEPDFEPCVALCE